MRSRPDVWWSAATFFPGFAIVTVVAFADGGYFSETWAWTTLALVSLALIVLLLRGKIVLGRFDLAGLAALAGFIGWVGLSASWSPTPDDSLQEAQRGLIYVAALLAFVLLVEREEIRDHLTGVAAAVSLVAAYGLGERLMGKQPTATDPIQGTRLIEPLGYANALGILVVLSLLLSLGLALHAGSHRGRALWLAPIIVLLPAFAWTESRGGSFALVVGLLVLAVAERRTIATLLPGSRGLHATIGTGLAVVVVCVVVIAAFRTDRPLGPRVDYWSVAWSQWEANTWLGAGAGTFAQYWQREDAPVAVRDAHSLYLETLAELGPVGLLLLLVALTIPILAALSARDAPLTGVSASAYSAYLVHAGLDWDWEMPAVTLAGLLCAVGLLAAARQKPHAITIGRGGRRVFAVATLAIAGLALAGSLVD
ncbi:MAG: O-antigen ligase family protein [Actinomycetota bacterium]|nr:O-antigen ligase family protein [Actinomycetota bacterium]